MEGLEYAKTVLGNNNLPFIELYMMFLAYLHDQDNDVLGLLHLRKLWDNRTGVFVIYNVGARYVYSAVNFEHALCKIYLVAKMQLP
jgi:hypothetical protein